MFFSLRGRRASLGQPPVTGGDTAHCWTDAIQGQTPLFLRLDRQLWIQLLIAGDIG